MISSLEGQKVVGATSRMFTSVGTGEEETRYSIVVFESGAVLYMEGVGAGDKWQFFRSELDFRTYVSDLRRILKNSIEDWWMTEVNAKIKRQPLNPEILRDSTSIRRAS